jgi:acetyl esterase/lipase
MVTEKPEANKPQEIEWHLGARVLPPPAGASDVMYNSIANTPQPDLESMQIFPQNETEWLEFIAKKDAEAAAQIPTLIKQLEVSVKNDEIDGVKVHHVVPKEVDPKHKNHLFIYIHGGAFVLNAGEASLPEAILIATRTKMQVLSIDYRMPPKNPYPAGLDDIVTVYKCIMNNRHAHSMAMGGSSAGGNLTLAAVQKFIQLGIEVPGALYIGTPGADLSKTGDSLYTNEGVDRLLVTYDGLVEAAVRMYSGDYDLKDPRVSPIYGNFKGFPPTFLLTGTRDLLLSCTVRTHIKLRGSGAVADILVFEGLSHGDYGWVSDSPESQQAYAELNKFLLQHLL